MRKSLYTIICLVSCVWIFTCTQVSWEDPFTGDNTLAFPIISITGPNPYELNVNDKYNEFGAVAFDTTNGDSIDITERIVIVINNVDDSIPTDSPGEHIVKYYATGLNDMKVKAERLVRVLEITSPDTVKPVITITGSNPRILFVGGTYSEEGATAFDSVDGDLTDSIKIYGDSISTDNPDTFEVVYEVEDKAKNMAKEKRDVYVWEGGDTIPPVITLLGDTIMTVCAGGVFNDSGATATDNVDGDISYRIIDSGSVAMQKLGTYYLYYNVSDFAGNAAEEKIRTVTVIDTIPPTISINPPNPFNLLIGNPYTEWGATAHDNLDGDITYKLDTVGYIDPNTNDSVTTSVEGVYRVHYVVTDNSGYTIDTIRVINVIGEPDTIAPVITISGDNPMTIKINDPYIEPDATAVDNVDGDISSKIVITGTVDNTNIGTYTRTYNVSDNAGNKAVPKERTVNVVLQTTPQWGIGVSYSIGDLVTYNGQVYKCIQAHPSQPGWEPPNAPALWQLQK